MCEEKIERYHGSGLTKACAKGKEREMNKQMELLRRFCDAIWEYDTEKIRYIFMRKPTVRCIRRKNREKAMQRW